jgi:hypothetical protein
MREGWAEAFLMVAALVFVALVVGLLNRSAERDCRARGGQVIERPGEVNGCLRPARGR